MRDTCYCSLPLGCSEPAYSEMWKNWLRGKEPTGKDVKYFDLITLTKWEKNLQRMIVTAAVVMINGYSSEKKTLATNE